MTDPTDAEATSADTVSVMIGSYLDSGGVLTSGVTPALLASGAVGLDTLDYDMAAATYNGAYDDNLVSALAAAWGGSGSGTQEMSEGSGVSSGTVALTNTTGATILVAAQGTDVTAGDGAVYQTIEQPTNAIADIEDEYAPEEATDLRIPEDLDQDAPAQDTIIDDAEDDRPKTAKLVEFCS